MLHLRLPVVVEGRYDKSAILGMFSGTVVTTEGFGVFNSREKQALIKRISKDGIIILTDSDAGGKQIRSFISSIVPKEKIYQLYIPRISGKEKRKTRAGKEGVLGVEGVGGKVLHDLLAPFAEEGAFVRSDIGAPLLYELGLTGSDGSATKRDAVAEKLGLPPGMNSKAFAAAVNIVTDENALRSLVSELEWGIGEK